MEQLAIITKPGFGMRDADRPILWFGVEWNAGGALMCFDIAEAGEFIRRHNIANITELHGRACVVETDGPGSTVKFVRMFKHE